MSWEVPSCSIFFYTIHLQQYLYMCKLPFRPPQNSHTFWNEKWKDVLSLHRACCNPDLLTKLLPWRLCFNFTYHLASSTLSHWMRCTCTISCLSDLSRCQTLTRRLRHKNPDNCSVLSSQGLCQLFPVWKQSKGSAKASVHSSGDKETNFCSVFTFLSLCVLSFQSDCKCHRKKCQKNVPPLTHQTNPVYFSLRFSNLCRSFCSHLQTNHVDICSVAWFVTTDTDIHKPRHVCIGYTSACTHSKLYTGSQKDTKHLHMNRKKRGYPKGDIHEVCYFRRTVSHQYSLSLTSFSPT